MDIAARFNRDRIAAFGGWKSTVATVGITNSALDHAKERRENSCSTMPDGVTERLKAEWYRRTGFRLKRGAKNGFSHRVRTGSTS